jgi:hypothetical protein
MDESKKKKLFLIIGGLLLYLVSTGASYATFSYLRGEPGITGLTSPLPIGESRFRIDPNAPKTASCPLNGKMYTEAEKKIWEQRRPLGVMIENHAEARPQSGLSRADIIYEAVAEGGITRFMAIFYCGASAEEITVGPVRSARTYYLDWISEYGEFPLYAHVGGANVSGKANALGQIADYGWLSAGNDINQFSVGFPTFWRDYERLDHPVATEHTMYSTTDKLWEVAQKRGITDKDQEGNSWEETFTPWKFKEDGKDRGEVDKIEISFWSGYQEYNVIWEYDREANLYKRINGGSPHKDLNNDEQLTAKNVVVQFAQEKGPIDELKHLLYQTTGSGKALVFQDGQVIKGTWEKDDREERTKFLDNQGKEVSFNKGEIWIEVVPAGKEVVY